QRLADDGLDIAPLEVLEDAAVRYRGHFLEGLELPNFHDFEAWCVAERERVTRTQARVLNALIGRLADEPERALPHARALAGLLPYDETARAALIRLLTASGRFDEAKQQYQLGARLLKEIGAQPTGALSRALRGGPGENRAAPADLRLRAAPDAVPGPTTDVPALATELRAAGTDPLVGRDVEVDRLRSRFKALAAESSGRLVVIRGEPGIGKSRLLRAAVHMARESDALLLEACAYESEAIRPFALWIDALRALGSE